MLILSALGVALLTALAFPPFFLWPLSFVAFTWAAHFLLFKAQDLSPRKVGIYWGAFSLFVNIFGFYWLAYLFHEFANMPWLLGGLVALGIFLLLSVMSFLFGWIWPQVAQRIPKNFRPLVLFAWFFLWDSLDFRFFPWSPVMSVGVDRYLMSTVSLWGTPGWRLLFFAFAVVVARWIVSRRGWRQEVWKIGLFIFAMAGLTYGSGYLQYKSFLKRYPARQPVALIQGNIGNYEKKLTKLQVMPTVQNVLRIHEKLITDISQKMEPIINSPEAPEPWIFWAETAFPGFPTKPGELQDILMNWVKRTHGLHLVGAYDNGLTDFAGQQIRLDYNVVGLFHEAHGFLSQYEKRIRIPFGEYIPGDQYFPRAYEFLPAVNHFAKGESFVALPHPDPDGPVFVPVICYEILFNGFVRDFIAEVRAMYPNRSIILVNPTNDSWYGPTSEPYQHALLARWQAASVGLPMLRPTNTGISLVVAPWGEVLADDRRDETLVVYGQLPVEKLQKR